MSLHFSSPVVRSLRFPSSTLIIHSELVSSIIPHRRLASTKSSGSSGSSSSSKIITKSNISSSSSSSLSSSPSPSQKSIKSNSITTTPSSTPYPLLNPPRSTLPPPLNLPIRDTSKSFVSHYFSTGKAYLAFYKAGGLAVWHNAQRARAISASSSSSTGTPASNPNVKFNANTAVAQGHLSRSDWQLLRRSRADVARLPLFALVLLVCGEFTPLVVLALGSGVVPRTCRVPKQVQGERERSEKRRGRSFREGTLGVEGGEKEMEKNSKRENKSENEKENEAKKDEKAAVQALGTQQVLHIGRSLGLYSSTWDRMGMAPAWLVRPRLRCSLAYLAIDDAAIEHFGGVQGLEPEELRISLEERGVDVLGKTEVQLRGLLQDWLRARTLLPVTRLLLTRPSVWLGRK